MEGAVSSPLPPLLFSPYINLDCPGRAPFQGQIPGQKEREKEKCVDDVGSCSSRHFQAQGLQKFT